VAGKILSNEGTNGKILTDAKAQARNTPLLQLISCMRERADLYQENDCDSFLCLCPYGLLAKSWLSEDPERQLRAAL